MSLTDIPRRKLAAICGVLMLGGLCACKSQNLAKKFNLSEFSWDDVMLSPKEYTGRPVRWLMSGILLNVGQFQNGMFRSSAKDQPAMANYVKHAENYIEVWGQYLDAQTMRTRPHLCYLLRDTAENKQYLKDALSSGQGIVVDGTIVDVPRNDLIFVVNDAGGEEWLKDVAEPVERGRRGPPYANH